MTAFAAWIETHWHDDMYWYVKRLSGNDTLLNRTHQAGPYIPRTVLFKIFPELNQKDVHNPDEYFDLEVSSHGVERQVRAVWYNNKFRGGTRNETRLTCFGGQSSPLLKPDNTGRLTIFTFLKSPPRDTPKCRVWVCRNTTEEDSIENIINPVEPGETVFFTPSDDAEPPYVNETSSPCWLSPEELPTEWIEKYPTGQDIAYKSIEMNPFESYSPDMRLTKRRECEYSLFRSVETAVELPKIRKGFSNMKAFLKLAQSVLQRRKARSGRSLELHVRTIFKEEGLIENEQFAYQAATPQGRRPDFVFPSEAAYNDLNFPESQLRMLAVKTTCRDRWRQILNESDRKLSKIHLLTIQEGLTASQYQEMQQSKVSLVVPKPVLSKYPISVRPEIQTLSDFIQEIRGLSG